MVAPQLLALVRSAVGSGALDGPAVGRGHGGHPVCGDELELDVRAAAGRVLELRWRASGCPATYAVAAVGATVLPGVATDEVESVLRAGLAARGDLAVHERHAEAMFMRALRQALATAGPPA